MNFPKGGHRTVCPTVIITDLGGVLVDYDEDSRNRNFADLCRASPEKIGQFFRGEACEALEKRLLSPQQFFEEAKTALGFSGGYDEFVAEYCNPAHFTLIREVFELYFLELKPRNSVDFWLLPNINPLHSEHILSQWPGISSNCRRVYLSFELGLRKPDTEIFQRILKLGGRDWDKYIFVDNAEENVEAARRSGIGAVRFESARKLREALRHNGFALGV